MFIPNKGLVLIGFHQLKAGVKIVAIWLSMNLIGWRIICSKDFRSAAQIGEGYGGGTGYDGVGCLTLVTT